MARNMKASWQIIFSAATRLRDTQKKNTTRLRPRKNTPTQIHANSVKNTKNQHQINQAAKT
jgi:hypothetical protein